MEEEEVRRVSGSFDHPVRVAPDDVAERPEEVEQQRHRGAARLGSDGADKPGRQPVQRRLTEDREGPFLGWLVCSGTGCPVRHLRALRPLRFGNRPLHRAYRANFPI